MQEKNSLIKETYEFIRGMYQDVASGDWRAISAVAALAAMPAIAALASVIWVKPEFERNYRLRQIQAKLDGFQTRQDAERIRTIVGLQADIEELEELRETYKLESNYGKDEGIPKRAYLTGVFWSDGMYKEGAEGLRGEPKDAGIEKAITSEDNSQGGK
jgi:hypothetical protein